MTARERELAEYLQCRNCGRPHSAASVALVAAAVAFVEGDPIVMGPSSRAKYDALREALEEMHRDVATTPWGHRWSL